ncbi:MAG: hypothetical protein ACYDCO_07180 [Armatimonadota bacterium]
MQRLLHLCLLGLACLAQAAPSTLATFTPTVSRYQDTLYVPARPLAEMIGADITENAKGVTTLKLGTKSVTFTPGKDGAFALFNGGLAVPLRACAGALGMTAADGRDTVTLTVPGQPPVTFPVEDGWGETRDWCDRAWTLFMMKPDGSGLRRLSYRNASGMGIGMVSFAPDGSFLLTYNENGQAIMRPAATREERVVCGLGGAGLGMTLPVSADGTSFFLHWDGQISRVGLADGVKKVICPASDYAVSPNGKYLAAVQNQRGTVGKLMMISLEKDEQRELGFGANPVFTPDNNQLVFRVAGKGDDGKDTDALIRYTMQPAENRTVYRLPGGHNIPLAFNPDGQQLLFNSYAGRALCALDFATGKARKLAGWQNDLQFRLPRFTADGKAIIALQADGDLFRITADGSRVTRLTKGFRIETFTFTPGGEYVVFLGMAKEED